MKYIDADKLLAEIEQLNSLVPYENNDRHDDGLHDAYKAVKNVIASLQQEAEEERKERERVYRESSAAYWKCVQNNIDRKRILPTFKGQLLHDFKNELHTMKQIIGLINHPEIPEGLFDKLALVFAAWGGYHFHPNNPPASEQDSLQQEQTEDVVSAANVLLEALSKTPYNNKPITDAQIIIKQLLMFFDSPASYNPDAINQEQPEADLDFSMFAKEIDAVYNLPKEITENTNENPLNWEYAIARHFYKFGLNARKEK